MLSKTDIINIVLWCVSIGLVILGGLLLGVGLGRLEPPAEEDEDEGDPQEEADEKPPGDS